MSKQANKVKSWRSSDAYAVPGFRVLQRVDTRHPHDRSRAAKGYPASGSESRYSGQGYHPNRHFCLPPGPAFRGSEAGLTAVGQPRENGL